MQPVSATVTTAVSSSALIAPFTFPATINCPLSSISPLKVTPSATNVATLPIFIFLFDLFKTYLLLLGNSYSSSGREFYPKLAQFVESLERNKTFKKKSKIPRVNRILLISDCNRSNPKHQYLRTFLFLKFFSNLS